MRLGPQDGMGSFGSDSAETVALGRSTVIGIIRSRELHRRSGNIDLDPASGFGRSATPFCGISNAYEFEGEMMETPFRADHVGSLLRPAELLRARGEWQAGRISAAELRRVEDGAIGDAVRMQREIGLDGVTDGEFRRG